MFNILCGCAASQGHYSSGPATPIAPTVAEVDLRRRVKAYGGALRRRPAHGLHILLWEPADTDPQAQDLPLPAR